MVIDSYAKNKDQALALQRWNEIGSGAPKLLTEVATDPGVKPSDFSNFSSLINLPPGTIATSAAQITPASTKAAGTPAAATKAGGGKASATPAAAAQATVPAIAPIEPTITPAPSSGINPIVLLVVFCLVTLVIGAALVYVLFLRKRSGGAKLPAAAHQAQEASRTAERTDFAAAGQEPPIAQFMTTYMVGDDLYDDSFSIDSPSGEFLGECGVGISDTIGVGDPKKVTAFEVWLFDKNDIQTVTKVLMSKHAFDDPTISQRLASKGEPVLVEPNKQVMLETATLVLEARVVDMSYGQSALPTDSYFERMTLELAVWPKAA